MFAGMDKLGGGVVGDVITERKVSMITMGESAATARCVSVVVPCADNTNSSATSMCTRGVQQMKIGDSTVPKCTNAGDHLTVVVKVTLLLIQVRQPVAVHIPEVLGCSCTRDSSVLVAGYAASILGQYQYTWYDISS